MEHRGIRHSDIIRPMVENLIKNKEKRDAEEVWKRKKEQNQAEVSWLIDTLAKQLLTEAYRIDSEKPSQHPRKESWLSFPKLAIVTKALEGNPGLRADFLAAL